MLQLPIPNVAASTTSMSWTIGVHPPAALPGCLAQVSSFKLTSELAGCQRNQVVQKSYSPVAARDYHVKLQCQKHTKQHTPDISWRMVVRHM